MKIYDYKTKCLEFILSYFRTNSDIVNIIQTPADRFNSLQDIIQYLLDSLIISKARGQRLDYIGKEVGTIRDEIDFGDYFCINREHINKNKLFYFLSSGVNPRIPLTLPDAAFIQKIYACIGANSSSGCIEEILSIIKKMTDADNVLISQGSNGGININIYGEELLVTQNTVSYIRQILGDGIYIEEIKTND